MKAKFLELFRKHDQIIVLIVSTIVSVTALVFYYTHHLTLEYNDAASHLNIARRITDSLTPGIVQIGSNWLPLLHLLELPLAINFFLWQSGFAGSTVSMLSFIISVLAIYKIVTFLTKDKVSGLIGAFAFATNANLLYMQTTAMFEPLLIATCIWSIYFLLKWGVEQKISQLLIGALLVFFATLTRYEGWFLFIFAVPYVFIISIKKRNYKYAEGRTIIFLFLGGLGIVLWLIYNQTIFGSATYFMSSEFSARGQQIIWEQLGKLPAKGNILLAIWTYSKAVIYNSGWIAFILGILGLISLFFKKIKLQIKISLAVFLFVPYIFHCISLFIGQSIIWLPDVTPFDPSFFNVRYGLIMLPSIAILIGFLTVRSKSVKAIVLLLLLLQAVTFYYNGGQLKARNITDLKDTMAGNNITDTKTAQWIGKNCSDGLTLISAAGFETIVFRAGLTMNHFITEGTGKYWKASLMVPTKYAKCIVFGESWLDKIKSSMSNNVDFQNNYIKAANYGSMQMYIKK